MGETATTGPCCGTTTAAVGVVDATVQVCIQGLQSTGITDKLSKMFNLRDFYV